MESHAKKIAGGSFLPPDVDVDGDTCFIYIGEQVYKESAEDMHSLALLMELYSPLITHILMSGHAAELIDEIREATQNAGVYGYEEEQA